MQLSGLAPRSLNLSQSEAQKAQSKDIAVQVNAELKAKGLKHKQNLGQSEFLKLLVTQLKYQDPLSPMKDKDFIAQMAQFSALEQMTKVNKSIGSLISQAGETGAYQLLGKKVTWFNTLTSKMSNGEVSSLEKHNGKVMLNVRKQYVDPKDVVKIEEGNSNNISLKENK